MSCKDLINDDLYTGACDGHDYCIIGITGNNKDGYSIRKKCYKCLSTKTVAFEDVDWFEEQYLRYTGVWEHAQRTKEDADGEAGRQGK